MEQPRLRAIADDVQARGKEFTLLARLSPVPSWANNYGLALAGVEFEDYLPASVVAVLPALVAPSSWAARSPSCRRREATRRRP